MWGLLALVLMVVGPLVGVAWKAATRGRGSDAPTEVLYEALRRSQGRVRGRRLQNAAVGLRDVLPLRVQLDDGTEEEASGLCSETIADGGSLLLIGEGGSGKSELLHRVHRDSYRSTDPNVPLVEVVSLGAYSGERRGVGSVLDWATVEIARRYGKRPRSVRALADESRLVIAFDALDEARPILKAGIVRTLAEWSRHHPVLVTSRSTETLRGSLAQLEQDGSVRRADVQSLASGDVDRALAASPETDVPGLRENAMAFSNPLRLQLLVLTAKQRPLGPAEVVSLVRDPGAVIERVLRGNTGGSVGLDPALRLAATVSADIGKDPGVAFRVLPFQFAGLTFWVTRVLMLGVLAGVWFGLRMPVVASAMGVAIFLTTPYERQSPLFRLLHASRLRVGLTLFFGAVSVATIAVLSACYVAVSVLSDRFGTLWVPEPEGVLGLSLVSMPLFYCFVLSPLSLDSSFWTLSSYLRTRAWPQFALLALSVVAIVLLPPGVVVAVIGVVIYLATTCMQLCVSHVFAWVTSGAAPWQWEAMLRSLVARGVLAGDRGVYKFVHAEVEQRVLWAVAVEPSTPRVLWRIFGEHWAERMLDRPLGRIGLVPTRAARRSLDDLGRNTRWSGESTSSLVDYHQFVEVLPERALALARRGARSALRWTTDLLLIDALDRVGDPRGLIGAERVLARPLHSTFDLYWALRVVRRHEDSATTLHRMEAMLRRSTMKRSDITGFLTRQLDEHRRSMSLVAGPGAVAPDPSEAVDAAMRAAGDARSAAVHHARIAQAAHAAGEAGIARRRAALGVSAASAIEGYDEMIEIMLTGAVLAEDEVARSWMRRAIDSGLRYGEPPLLRSRLPSSEFDVVFDGVDGGPERSGSAGPMAGVVGV
jgi:hypothetical protein